MIGLIGIKEGMTQIFSDDGNIIPVTIIKIEKNIVINKKLNQTDGYDSLVIGTIDAKENRLTKPFRGQFKENIKPKKYLKEFRIDNPEKYEIGQEIGLDIFTKVNFIDVIGTSKGKGYQGVVKRHHFHGGPKSHGSKFHRHNGSTGQNTYPSRVYKNIKRAGRMGNEKVTVQNLKIVEIDNNNNVILVKGCVPGKNKQLVYLTKSIKKAV